MRVLSLALAPVLATGCVATFARFEPPVPSVELAAEARRALHLEVTSETRQFDRSGLRMPAHIVAARDYAEGVAEAFEACHCLSGVVSEGAPSDLRARVAVTREAQNNAALLNLATMFLIPAIEDRKLAIEIELADRSGRVVRVERSYAFRVWYDVLFVPLYPWLSPARFEKRVETRLFQAAAAQALGRVLGSSSARAEPDSRSRPGPAGR